MVIRGVPDGERISCIAGKRFIAPFARQHNFNVVTCQSCDHVERHTGRPDDRLVLVPDQLRQRTEKLISTQDYFMMDRIQVFRHLPGIGQFTVAVFSIAH